MSLLLPASPTPSRLLLHPPQTLIPPALPASQTLTLALSRRERRTHRFPTISDSPIKPFSSSLSISPISIPFFRCSSSFSSSALFEVAPFLQSEWPTILKGWLCSAGAVYCLSRAVPRLGRLPCYAPERMVSEGLALAALACARAATCFLQQAFLWDAALRSTYKIRVHLFNTILQRDLAFFVGDDGVPAGDIAHRITAEASDVADTVYALLNTVVPSTLQLVAMGARMVVVSPVLSLVTIMAIPCMLVISAYLGEWIRKISRRANLSVARLSAYLNEVIPSMLVVKANNGEFNESLSFQKLAHNDLVERLKKRKMRAFIPQLVQVMYVGGLLVLAAGSLVILRNSFDASKFLSFAMSFTLLVEPIQAVGKAYNEWKQGEPAMERLFDLTSFKNKVIEKPDAVDLDYVTGDIKFCGVTFRYGDNKPLVLNGLNLHIKSGERVALIGPSGGGKTTLTQLLLRLYDPLSGHILVDDHDIQDVRLKSLREHIVLVSQDIMLFSGTVAENIGYRDPIGKIDMERVENAARIANADEFIRTLPRGYQTNIGQRGSLLSGGQKQRLAIARALYQRSSILILDEATSALDSRSELLVRQALENLMANHTVLVITHRLETVLMADRVFLLDRGKLEEVPKPSRLAQDGLCDSPALRKLIV